VAVIMAYVNVIQARQTCSSTLCGVSGRSATSVVKLTANDVEQVHENAS